MSTATATPAATPAATKPAQTFSVRTELRRQASRPRTRITLALMALLPLIVLGAFELGGGEEDNTPSTFDALSGLATASGANFAVFNLLVSSSFLLIVVVALFFGDTVASEASWGSLRYLLAIPVPRSRLLGVKLIVALIYSGLALLILVGTAFLAGTIRYGWAPLRSMISDEIPAGEGFVRLLGAAGYIGITMLVVAALAFLLSVVTDAPLGAVGGAVLIQILSSILNQIEALGTIREFLPTYYANAWLGFLSTPVQLDGPVRGSIVALSYATVLFGLAFWHFRRKDVVS